MAPEGNDGLRLTNINNWWLLSLYLAVAAKLTETLFSYKHSYISDQFPAMGKWEVSEYP